MVFNCQFSQENEITTELIKTLRLRKRISQRGIDTLGLLPLYEM